MNDRKPSTQEAVEIISPPVCSMCSSAHEHPYDIHITAIESTEGGWQAHGKGQYKDQRYCSNCGKIYEAIINVIPIQCRA